MTPFAELLPVACEAADLAADLLRSHQPGLVTAKGDAPDGVHEPANHCREHADHDTQPG